MKAKLNICLIVLALYGFGTSGSPGGAEALAAVVKPQLSHQTPTVEAPLLRWDSRQGGDTIEDAVPIAVGETLYGNTVGYNNDYDEMCPYGGNAPDVVYIITAEENGSLTFDLCDSDYDTKILVWDEDLNLVACNDDACSNSQGDFYRSFATPYCSAGESYYVIVDGYGMDAGDYQLHVGADWCADECPPGATPEGEQDCHDDYVDVSNGGCFSEPPVFGTIECGETICGTSGVWNSYSDYQKDHDWYLFILSDSATVTWTVYADFTVTAQLFDFVDCENYGNQVFASDTVGACQETVVTVNDLEPGVYVANVEIYDCYLWDCGLEYWGRLECAYEEVEPVLEVAGFTLSQNYPNPFNPTTTIEFTLPRPEQVAVSVYNLQGELVAVLAAGVFGAGVQQLVFDATGLPSGIYLYRLQAGELAISRKLILLQ